MCEAGGALAAGCLYAPVKQDMGSAVELSFNGSRVQGKVTRAHDPPRVGAGFDRLPWEGQSYRKDFRPLRLGVFRLEKGCGKQTLRALDIQGLQVLDVRAFTLTLLRD